MDRKIIEQLAKEYKLPEHIIEKIVAYPFKFQVDIMKDGTYRPVRHPYLGVFAVKPGRRELFRGGKYMKPNEEQS